MENEIKRNMYSTTSTRRLTISKSSGFNPKKINETTPDPCTFNKLNPIEPNDLVSDELTKFQIVIAK